ncbi:MAG TPA: hypothetical protein VKV27_04130 [Solirubrobacteraceae bacterium]|nr:hypothetical protein [Solirubrobacteraceae bacterium]
MNRDSDNPLLAVLPHIACCGGPLLIIAVVAGAISLADLGIGLAAVGALVIAVVLWRTRYRTCAPAITDHEPSVAPEREVGRVAGLRHSGIARRGTDEGSDAPSAIVR